MTPTDQQDPTEADETDRHLQKLAASLGKSDASRKLLIYLAQCSRQGQVPKELDIAVDVFGKDASFTGSDDAVVRVQVRALRQKLDDYYRGEGKNDPFRVEIPKGAYRLNVTKVDPTAHVDAPAPAHELAGPVATVPSAYRLRANIATAVAVAAVLALGLLLAVRSRPFASPEPETAIDHSFVWSDLEASDRPLTIVLGDLLLFSQVDPTSGHSQWIRDPFINSADQLHGYIGNHPPSSTLGQSQTTLLPKSVALGLAAVLPIVNRRHRHVDVTLLDELKLDDLRDHDVVYIGPLVRLGPLAERFSQFSRYHYDDASFQLTDKASKRVYALQDRSEGLTDYGLFALIPGPSNNHIMIFASVARDVGLLQIIRTVTSAQGVDAIRAKVGGTPSATPRSFEVLMAVSGYRRTDLTADIVEAHSLDTARTSASR